MQKMCIILLILFISTFFCSIDMLAMSLYYDGKTHDYNAKPIILKINGEPIVTEMPPIIIDDRTLVPAREVFEKLGANVIWDEKYKQVYVMYKNKMIVLTIGSNMAYINQITHKLDVPAKLINEKTMIPARFVASNLGFNVKWSNVTRTVSISDKDVITPQDKTVLGYATYYSTGSISSYNSIVANTELLDQIITHTYTVDGQGNLTGLIPTKQISIAKANGIKLEASVSNQFNSKVAHELLQSGVNRKNAIDNIVEQMKKYGYSGICIDFEQVYAKDREYMTQFMKELYTTVNKEGYSVTIALPAKTYDDKISSWQGAFDYVALKDYADQFVLMAYDEHYISGVPGPIASAGWVEKVVKYASDVLPKEKILLGLGSYGYDWSLSTNKAYTVNQAQQVAKKYGATIKIDPISGSPYYKYIDLSGIKHEVWFENENSIVSKLELINEYELKGISIWALGSESTAYMDRIREMLREG